MKRIIFISFVLFIVPSFAQSPVDKISPNLKSRLAVDENKEQNLVWIYFTDKGNDIQKYYSNPESVVSEKSLKRRDKVLAKKNAIDFTDLPVNDDYIYQLISEGFLLKQKSKWFNAVSGYATEEQLNKISSHYFVSKIDIVQKLSRRIDDVEFDESDLTLNKVNQPEEIYSLNYGNSYTQANIINVPQVHNLGYNGSGITICVMDAGFGNLGHEVFQNMNIIAKYDFVNSSATMTSNSHGTAVLSLIGGFKEGQLIGPAYGSNYILARTEDVNSETPVEEDNWIAALEWADSIGVDVTTTSLGYLEFDSPYADYTWEDMDGNTAKITIAGDLAVAKGIVVVNAAGNEGYNSTRNTLGAPADGDSILAIGSVDYQGIRAYYSSVGPTVDGRIKPDFMAMGMGTYIATLASTTSYATSTIGGTSYSCPQAAGVVALLLSKNPDLTPMQIRDILRQTSSYSSNPDREYGWGIINALEAFNNIPTSVEDQEILEDFYLLSNYPNPFNPSTKIIFSIPAKEKVLLTLHDILGSEIRVLFNDFAETGIQEIELNGFDLASGIYLVRMVSESVQKSHKISLIK